MDTYVSESAAGSQVGEAQSHEWVRPVIALLDVAACQLDHEQAVHDAIVQATSLLRKQITSQVAEVNSSDRGRLIAWQARKVRDYIDSHITGPILVSDLCALVRLSEAHFSRSFKRAFGQTPHAFVLRRRLEFAAQFMLQTDAPLCDIALRCGFADQAHLSKQFRQANGLNSSAWRRTARTTPLSMNMSVTSSASSSTVSRRDILAGAAGVLAASALSAPVFAAASKAGAAPRAANAHYLGIKAFSETDQTEDLKAYPGYPHGMLTVNADVINPGLLVFIKG
jgi:AraC family transcriptional regulator